MLDARDLIESLDDMGVSIDDLSDYCAGEGQDFLHIVSRRREEDLAELRSHLIAGLEKDLGEPATVEWRELPEGYDFQDEDEDEDHFSPLPEDADTLPPLPTYSHSDLVPDFFPPFPVMTEPEPEDIDAALMPPPPVPLLGANMPTLPSQTLTSTSTSAKDYLIRNQYELSSLSSTPEWHLPPDMIPMSSFTKALPLVKQQKANAATSASQPALDPQQATYAAYHHILTHQPPEDTSELGLPSHAKHKVLLEMLFPSLSTERWSGSLCDKWDSPDTLFGTLACNAPRPPGGSGSSGLNGTLPYPLGQHPSIENVPKHELKGAPDDRTLASFPSPNPPGGRYVGGLGVGYGGDRVVGLVGHKVGVSKLNELARITLNVRSVSYSSYCDNSLTGPFRVDPNPSSNSASPSPTSALSLKRHWILRTSCL